MGMPKHKADLLTKANNNGDLKKTQKNQSLLIFVLTKGKGCALLFINIHFQTTWHL
jgi:hypothetical protein